MCSVSEYSPQVYFIIIRQPHSGSLESTVYGVARGRFRMEVTPILRVPLRMPRDVAGGGQLTTDSGICDAVSTS